MRWAGLLSSWRRLRANPLQFRHQIAPKVLQGLRLLVNGGGLNFLSWQLRQFAHPAQDQTHGEEKVGAITLDENQIEAANQIEDQRTRKQ